jgi:predicted component of type VI protein secretion system
MGANAIRTLLGVKDPQGARIIVWDTKDVSIGRAPENDIVVEDSDASRRHALLSRVDGDYVLEDLGTFNATRVNGDSVEKHTLSNRDVIEIANLEITFIQSRKDPAALGLDVVYASQLKDFAASQAGVRASDATTLGFIEIDSANQNSDKFEVGSVGTFAESDSEAIQDRAVSADLDPQLDESALENPAAEAPQPAAAPGPSASHLSLRVEIIGLTPDLTRTVTALLGKVIEMPPLRIRLTGDG